MNTNNQHIDLKDRTKKFALRIIKITKTLTKNIAEREIARQLIRSGMSVGAILDPLFEDDQTKSLKQS